MKLKYYLVSLVFAFTSQTAFASLLGDTINGSTGAVTTTPASAVVGAGVEFTGTDFGLTNDIWTADFFASGFDLKVEVVSPDGNISGGGGRQWVFTDLDWVGMPGRIIGVNLLSSIGATFATPGIAFGDHSITITQGTLNLDANGGALFTSGRFEIIAEHVPEPATLALMGLGLAGIGFRRRQAA